MKHLLLVLAFCCSLAGQKINPFGPVPQLRICPNVSANDQVLDVAPNGSTWVCKTLTFTNLGGSIALGQTPLTTRGDVLTVNSATVLIRLPLGGNNLYLKSNTLDLIYSTLPAAGTGSGAAHQFATALNADAAPTFLQPTLADINGGTAPGAQTYNLNSNPIQNVVLNGSGNGNAVTLLNEQGPTGTLTGNSSDQTIYTYSLPANTLAAGKGLHVRSHLSRGAVTGSMTVKLFFGAAACINDAGAAAGTEWLEFWVFNNSGVQNAQHGYGDRTIESGMPFGTTCSPAENTTNAVTIKVTFNAANTDTMQGTGFLVDLVQ